MRIRPIIFGQLSYLLCKFYFLAFWSYKLTYIVIFSLSYRIIYKEMEEGLMVTINMNL